MCVAILKDNIVGALPLKHTHSLKQSLITQTHTHIIITSAAGTPNDEDLTVDEVLSIYQFKTGADAPKFAK